MSNEIIITTEQFEIQEPLTELRRKELETDLLKLEGVEKLSFEKETIKVSFYAQLISTYLIKTVIEKTGIALGKYGKPKVLDRFINRLIESNRKNFGSASLDCCDLNRK